MKEGFSSPQKILYVNLLFSVFLIVLGFNTLDMMMWHPRHEHPWLLPEGQWNMGPFWINDWHAYIFFGILSLSAGCFILGWIANGRLEKRGNP